MSAPGIHNHWPYVVFDLDGTLVDTIDLIVESYRHCFAEVLGPEIAHPDVEQIRSWIGRPLIEVFEAEWPEHCEALTTSYVSWNLANTERLIRGYDGVRDVVEELLSAGVKVAVATSKRREPAQLALQLLAFPPLDALVGLEDTDAHKPDPAPLLEAVRRLGGTASQSVYVGDAVVDVQAGKAAGMATVAVTWGAGEIKDLQLADPTALVRTPADLADVLGIGVQEPRIV